MTKMLLAMLRSTTGTTVTINDVGSSCAGAGKYTLSFSDDCVDGLTSTRQR